MVRNWAIVMAVERIRYSRDEGLVVVELDIPTVSGAMNGMRGSRRDAKQVFVFRGLARRKHVAMSPLVRAAGYRRREKDVK